MSKNKLATEKLMTIQQIAKKCGVSRRTVKRRIDRLGITPRTDTQHLQSNTIARKYSWDEYSMKALVLFKVPCVIDQEKALESLETAENILSTDLTQELALLRSTNRTLRAQLTEALAELDARPVLISEISQASLSKLEEEKDLLATKYAVLLRNYEDLQKIFRNITPPIGGYDERRNSTAA